MIVNEKRRRKGDRRGIVTTLNNKFPGLSVYELIKMKYEKKSILFSFIVILPVLQHTSYVFVKVTQNSHLMRPSELYSVRWLRSSRCPQRPYIFFLSERRSVEMGGWSTSRRYLARSASLSWKNEQRHSRTNVTNSVDPKLRPQTRNSLQ
jgi:hypothetical protein